MIGGEGWHAANVYIESVYNNDIFQITSTRLSQVNNNYEKTQIQLT